MPNARVPITHHVPAEHYAAIKRMGGVMADHLRKAVAMYLKSFEPVGPETTVTIGGKEADPVTLQVKQSAPSVTFSFKKPDVEIDPSTGKPRA